MRSMVSKIAIRERERPVEASSRLRSRLAILAAILALSGSGCGGERLVPVEGRVLLDDKALPVASLLLVPDAAKGNTTASQAAGEVEADGKYKLYTNRKPGAPLGWYKIAVVATEPPDPKNPSAARPTLIPLKYNRVETSGVSMEVVEKPAPGAYDVKLSKE